MNVVEIIGIFSLFDFTNKPHVLCTNIHEFAPSMVEFYYRQRLIVSHARNWMVIPIVSEIITVLVNIVKKQIMQ